MADLSDILEALAAQVGAEFYPDGTGTASAAGGDVDIYVIQGWPLPANLDRVGASGNGGNAVVYVSIFPVPNLSRPMANALQAWTEIRSTVPTVMVDVEDDTVTLAGNGAYGVGQTVALLVGNKPYGLPVQPTATATSLASGLATLVAGDWPGTVSNGPVLTIPGAPSLLARVGGVGTLMVELEREQQALMISVWAPTPPLRKVCGRLARSALASIPRLALADGSGANLTYRMTNESDRLEKVALYRRDIHYWVEFATYDTVEGVEVIMPAIIGLGTAA